MELMQIIPTFSENLRKNYSRGAEEVHALAGISMEIREGDKVVVFTLPSGIKKLERFFKQP